jgi:hypothetical protein
MLCEISSSRKTKHYYACKKYICIHIINWQTFYNWFWGPAGLLLLGFFFRVKEARV